ncbi:hypothetical protein M0R36_10580 [bacterium]|jgi:hypothetical protein|nr:hypothetical protein [bacterium]
MGIKYPLRDGGTCYGKCDICKKEFEWNTCGPSGEEYGLLELIDEHTICSDCMHKYIGVDKLKKIIIENGARLKLIDNESKIIQISEDEQKKIEIMETVDMIDLMCYYKYYMGNADTDKVECPVCDYKKDRGVRKINV